MKFDEKQTKQFCNNSIDLYNVDVHTKNKACSMQYFIYTKFIAFKTFHISDM